MINPARNVVKVELSMEKCNVILATSVFNKKKEYEGFRRLIKRQPIVYSKFSEEYGVTKCKNSGDISL
jgi:hypothetical protein